MQAMQIIRQRASSGFNVNGLLDEMAISRRKLERRFREALGQTPAQEIRKAQLDAAKRLLIDTNLPMDKVAQASGLGYERRLRLLFASQMKTTPLAFRKLFRRNF
jgi:transcriptional regulator GlxA family with amidase domain